MESDATFSVRECGCNAIFIITSFKQSWVTYYAVGVMSDQPQNLK